MSALAQLLQDDPPTSWLFPETFHATSGGSPAYKRTINLAHRCPLRLFDVYLAVDWSARSKPSTVRPTHDALWIGETLANRLHDITITPETYWRTRHACVEYLRSRLVYHSALGRRVLAGFDS